MISHFLMCHLVGWVNLVYSEQAAKKINPKEHKKSTAHSMNSNFDLVNFMFLPVPVVIKRF